MAFLLCLLLPVRIVQQAALDREEEAGRKRRHLSRGFLLLPVTVSVTQPGFLMSTVAGPSYSSS